MCLSERVQREPHLDTLQLTPFENNGLLSTLQHTRTQRLGHIHGLALRRCQEGGLSIHPGETTPLNTKKKQQQEGGGEREGTRLDGRDGPHHDAVSRQ